MKREENGKLDLEIGNQEGSALFAGDSN